MDLCVRYGKQDIAVSVSFSDRRRLSITVHPDCRVTAKAPTGCSPEEVLGRLNRRAGWIARQQAYFRRHQPQATPRLYVPGETHCYLGRQYRLRIRLGSPARVRLVGGFFELELPEPSDREKAKELMLCWYREHARPMLEKRLPAYLPAIRLRGGREPQVRFRRMTRRWGSCSANGVIMLNTELVKAPVPCIDYVIVHELCHLLHPRHDKAFFRLLGRLLPDWERRKERLEQVSL